MIATSYNNPYSQKPSNQLHFISEYVLQLGLREAIATSHAGTLRTPYSLSPNE